MKEVKWTRYKRSKFIWLFYLSDSSWILLLSEPQVLFCRHCNLWKEVIWTKLWHNLWEQTTPNKPMKQSRGVSTSYGQRMSCTELRVMSTRSIQLKRCVWLGLFLLRRGSNLVQSFVPYLNIPYLFSEIPFLKLLSSILYSNSILSLTMCITSHAPKITWEKKIPILI